MKKLFFIVSALTLIAGCGGKMQQDPLGALPPINGESKPGEREKPGSAEAIRPNLLDGYEFNVDEKKEIVLNASILESNYELEVIIENMSDFPGATFNKATRTFGWTPTGSIFNGQLNRRMQLNVVFIGKPSSKNKTSTVVFRRDWPVKIDVTRSPSQPQITQWSIFPAFVQEGSITKIWLQITDKDAGKSMDQYPRLVLNGVAKGAALEPYIKISDVQQISTDTFKYEVLLDLEDVELTTSVKDFELQFSPQSQFGATGGSKTWSVTVYTSLKKPVSTWTGVQKFKAGVENTYVFTVFDGAGEGTLEYFAGLAKLPVGANVKCDNSQNASYLVCTMTWTPDPMQVGQTFNSTISVKSSFTYNYLARDARMFAFDLKSEVVN